MKVAQPADPLLYPSGSDAGFQQFCRAHRLTTTPSNFPNPLVGFIANSRFSEHRVLLENGGFLKFTTNADMGYFGSR